MAIEDLAHQGDLLRTTDMRQPHDATMQLSQNEDEVPEVLVHGDQDSLLGDCPGEDRFVPGILTTSSGFFGVVALPTQPVAQATRGAAVEEKPHAPATRTASRLSLANTARAYSRQAWMSSRSRSG